MKQALTSLPNYRWPERWLSRGAAPWRALAAVAFYAARSVGWAVSVVRPTRAAVAVVRTDGVGDAILFEPALRSLALQFDGYDLHLWAPDGVCAVLKSHACIRRQVVVPKGFKEGNYRVFWSIPWRARLGYQLGRNRYAVAVYPPDDPEPLGSWLFAWMRADEKWLNSGRTLNQFDWQQTWTAGFATKLLHPRPGGGHELQRAAHLAEQWGSAIDGIAPDVPLSPRALTYASVHVGAARHAVRRLRASGLVGIVPAGSNAINQYPLEKWAEVLRRLWEQHTLLPALLGGPQDEPVLQQLAQALGDVPHHRFPTDCDIAVSIVVVSRLDGLISVDTGLAHAAAAFDLPAVVLVTGGMPGRFWPWPTATRSIALTKPMPCAGCQYRCSQESAHCLTDLSPEWIVDALMRSMSSTRILAQAEPRTYRHAG